MLKIEFTNGFSLPVDSIQESIRVPGNEWMLYFQSNLGVDSDTVDNFQKELVLDNITCIKAYIDERFIRQYNCTEIKHANISLRNEGYFIDFLLIMALT